MAPLVKVSRVIKSGKPSGDRVSFRSPSPSPNTFRRSAWRRSPTFVKAPEPKSHPRAGHAQFSGRRLHLTRRRVRAREAFSGDAPPPPASPDADQPPYIPGSPIRALHVPLLGIFVSVGPPNSLSGEAPATFSPPQSLHVPWEVFFYLSGGTTPRSEPPSSSTSQTSQASIASVAQPGSFSSITTTSALPTVTLANGSQTVAKGPEYGKTIGIGLSPSSRRWSLVFSTLSSLPCESCQLGKHTRVSFPKRLNNRAKSPFELVHTDVWGPCRTASTLGFQYFVTFIDDYSRSERKNRHLVETARTILLHSNVPFRFWGDAVLTACYLINRMPSSVLHDQIPHSLLFPDQPLYFLPPRVFGCTCFVHILTPGQDKLSAKAMKCLFLDIPDFRRVYHRRPRVAAPLPFAEAPADSLPTPSASPAPALPSPDDLPIAIRKGTRSTRNPHPIYNFLSYHRLSSPYSAFVSAISSVSLPKSTHEALSHPGWRQAMVDEMAALHFNGTWDLVVLPSGKSTVGCRWVYAVKVGPDVQVDRLKARLVAKGYTQVYGSDYGDTFSPVAKIASVRLLLSMAAMCSWPLYQLDIKNVFLYGDLVEEVYMEQPPGFVAQGESGLVCRLRRSLYGLKQSPRAWFGRFSSVVQEFGMLCSTADHSVFYHHNSLGQCIYLVVYVDDIVITGSDQDDSSIQFRCGPFPKEVCFRHPGRNRTPGQGVLYENRGHTQVVGYTDADWAGSPTDRRSTSGYCVFIGGNLISWKSKKQDVVARSSAEAEYRAMALATCELIWLRHLLQELRFGKDEQMKLICDNQAALHIASNPVFHERTKHIEVDCHFIREKIASGCVATSFVNSNDQLADIFTKSLRGPRIKYICNKLGAYDIYAPA
ncbi:Retrovirus-related Pol polyprotein from transposon TNT 1-94 [Vitis vinifera]|uniref:Retrovirus-related Pol polyprotein from transposon TNT 1-94 n=1 Tax=Vitis vinifera TaxID=29760 RepID=A0A438EAP0_VITVI|nr:Retrovirus-related Pol polyprotein from transposon TNT 1-94 [Vitis vinifera]